MSPRISIRPLYALDAALPGSQLGHHARDGLAEAGDDGTSVPVLEDGQAGGLEARVREGRLGQPWHNHARSTTRSDLKAAEAPPEAQEIPVCVRPAEEAHARVRRVEPQHRHLGDLA